MQSERHVGWGGESISRSSTMVGRRSTSSVVWVESSSEHGMVEMRLGSTHSGSWRNYREEEEEEALKWAALEKLPTFDRLRRGILTAGGGGEVVEVDNLGFSQRCALLNRLITHQDNHNFLLNLKTRVDRVGIELPAIEVRFQQLNVEAETYTGSRALPTFSNFFVNIFEGFLGFLHILSNRKQILCILKNISGIIKPSRMTLLLGPPSSGKTTFLLALAGKLDSELKSLGRVTYNGHEMKEFIPQRTAAYISQHDTHIGEMTVRETLAFSARCQGVGFLPEMLAELSRREKAANIKPDPDIDLFMKAAACEGQEQNLITDYVLKILGLEDCADTMVGNELVRGISGGQRKRVTTGEMLVGPARALFMDEISTGLDSSTTYQIVKSIRQSTHILDATTVISLLQPAPETFDLFDDIILLSEGQIVYQGPQEHVIGFFESMGFQCPIRKGVADFLQEVTSRKDQEQYWSREDQPYTFVTVEDFSESFQSFHVGQNIGEELSTPFDKSKSHPAALATEKYGVDKKELFKACFSREVLLLKRKAFIFIFKIFQLFVMAVIGTSVFIRTKMHRDTVIDGGIFMGALFFGVSSILFNSMQEMFLVIAKLPVFYKQRDFLFYPSWAFSLSTWIVKIPFSFVEAAALVFVTYYGIGYDHDVTRFMKQYFLAVILSQMAFSLFRTIGAIGREPSVAFTLGAFVLCVLFGLSGYVLSRDYIKKWWIWGYWASPMMYAQNALVVNEFFGRSWSHNGPNSSEALGVEVLKARGVFPHSYWYWIGVGALTGYVCLFTVMFTAALTFLGPLGKAKANVSEKPPSNLPPLGGSATELTNRGNSHQLDHSESRIRASTSRKRGMVLPFHPHSLTFDQMTYSIDMPQEMQNHGVLEDRLVLLKGVSGSFRPGILTALMGVTGAGKTTLMDVLAGRKTGGKIEGDLRISGYPKKQETFARVSGYCEQTDIHSPHVTVHESLIYSAWLRLPTEVDVDTRMMFVEQVMELVELNDLRQALVGLPGVNGLSTEQRKRLTIAVELVANPSIVFMDEPTSGLDARAAAIVMRAVRNTVDTGRTVVCTIHQPSIDIFESFDELLLLKRGGQEIYVGPLGTHSSLLIDYFQGIKGVSKIKDGYNPATWMMEVSCSAEEVALGVDFAALYKNSDLYKRNKELIKELSTPAAGSRDLYFPTKYPQSFATQFGACLWKQHLSYWRNPSYTAVNLLFTTIIALMIGTMFSNLGQNVKKRQDLMNVMGSMYVSVYFLGVKNSSAVQAVVSIERTISYRERAAGMYSALSHALAQVLIEIPYLFVQATIYTIITYAMIGYDWTATKFFWQFFFMFFTLLYFTFYGMMVMAVSPSYPIASLVASTFYGLWNVFSGFLIPRTRIPIWWRWFYWVCPVAWTLYGLVVAQYGEVQNEIESGETVEEFLRSYLGFRHDFLGVAATVVVAFGVLFALVFAISMKSINYLKR